MMVRCTLMTMKQNIDRISIQVGLSGYSFKIEADSDTYSSDWMGADQVFATSEFQKRYDEVEISVFTPHFALVPSAFYDRDAAAGMLAEVTDVDVEDGVEMIDVPEYGSVILYSDATSGTLSRVVSETVLRADGTKAHPLPEMYYMLRSLLELEEYNKILASYADGILYLAVAQGNTLMLCNSFKAQDFTTAQYFIFMVMKRLQLNPEMSTITFRTHLDMEQEISLYRYFNKVDHI